MTITISDLVPEVAKRADVTQAVARNVLQSVYGVMETHISSGEDVHLPGVGTLKVKTSSARVGFDFARKKKVTYPERRVLKLTVAPKMKATLAELKV